MGYPIYVYAQRGRTTSVQTRKTILFRWGQPQGGEYVWTIETRMLELRRIVFLYLLWIRCYIILLVEDCIIFVIFTLVIVKFPLLWNRKRRPLLHVYMGCFTFNWMPFDLCDSPTTFKNYMMSIDNTQIHYRNVRDF